MAVPTFDDLIPSNNARPQAGGDLTFDDLVPDPRKGSTQPIPAPGVLERIADQFTGSRRTEFPEAGEFAPALERVARERGTATTYSATPHQRALGLSSVTPDVNAQLDILKKHIPNLETRQDAHGNVMLRAPGEGVNDWTYLNAPGLSRRDAEELATQTVLTAPLLGAVGAGSTLFRRALIAAGLMGGGEVAKDLTATAAGSEQGVDPTRAGIVAGVGGALAPGVPTAIASTVSNAASVPFRPLASAVRGLVNPEREAARRVGTAEVRDRAAGTAQLTPADEAMAAQTGQPLTTVDYGGDTSRALARSAANTSPEGRGVIDRALGPRFETQSERGGDFLRQLVGPPANAHAAGQAINQARPGALGPLYQRAYQSGAVGIHTPTLAALEREPAMVPFLRAADSAINSKRAAGTLQTAARACC